MNRDELAALGRAITDLVSDYRDVEEAANAAIADATEAADRATHLEQQNANLLARAQTRDITIDNLERALGNLIRAAQTQNAGRLHAAIADARATLMRPELLRSARESTTSTTLTTPSKYTAPRISDGALLWRVRRSYSVAHGARVYQAGETLYATEDDLEARDLTEYVERA